MYKYKIDQDTKYSRENNDLVLNIKHTYTSKEIKIPSHKNGILYYFMEKQPLFPYYIVDSGNTKYY